MMDDNPQTYLLYTQVDFLQLDIVQRLCCSYIWMLLVDMLSMYIKPIMLYLLLLMLHKPINMFTYLH